MVTQALGWVLAVLMALAGLLLALGFAAGVWWREEVLRNIRRQRWMRVAKLNGEDHAGHP